MAARPATPSRPAPGRLAQLLTRRPPARLMACVIVLCAMAVATGCASTVAPGAPSAARTTAAPAAAAPAGVPLAAARPQRLLIPSLAVDTAVIDLGLNPDGTMAVPPDGSTAGWYVHSPTPGELGPSVLAAHVDWKGRPGVFTGLSRVAPGDHVQVRRVDGSSVEFTVSRVATYPKDRFPTAEVYGDVGSAQLRLITCGGSFDRTARSYRDNVVVYAERTG